MSAKVKSPAVFAVLVTALLMGAAAAVAARSSVTPPPAIKSAGQIVYCSDISYPPEESFAAGNKPIGSDIDIGTGIAKLMGVKATFKNTTFDSIIPALTTKKCDAIISGMNDTASRRKQVDFVDYLKVGQSLMVKKGNPEHITTLAALSGKRVRQPRPLIRGRRLADQPALDRHRHPQGRPAEAGGTAGALPALRERDDEEDRRQVGNDGRSNPAQIGGR
jgi:ABC-type amino acid transport substrate-binding protein